MADNLYQSWAYLILLAEVHSATGQALNAFSVHNITSAANCGSTVRCVIPFLDDDHYIDSWDGMRILY